MILNCVYIWKLCFGHFSQSQHSKLAPAADIEKKRHCQFPSRCRMLSTIWFSRWLFLNKILEAVNPNFNCLILYVWWCVLHCKFDAHWTQIWKDTADPMCPSQQNSPCLLQHNFFFCILNQTYFSNNCNCSLNNKGYYWTIFRLCCVQIWWLNVKILQIYETSRMPGCNSLPFWSPHRSPSGPFDIRIDYLSVPVRLRYD